MTEPSDLIRAFNASLRSSVDPITQELERIEAEIATREAELVDLRKLRTQARKVINAFSPNAKPKQQRANKTRVAQPTVDALAVWLRSNFTPADELTAPGLAKGAGAPLPYSTMAVALHQLHDAGVIRLDRIGDRRQRIYRLTEASP